MYSVGQIVLATLLGGPLGGGWLMALNYGRLGEPRKARLAIVVSVLAIGALIAIGLLAGPHAALWLILAPVVVVSQLATFLQADAHRRHVALGGSRASSWRAAGLGVVSLVIYTAVFLGAIITNFLATMPDKVMIGQASVFYTDGVSRAEALNVGEQLVALDPESRDKRWGVEVTRDDDRPVIAFITFAEDRSDPSIRSTFHRLAEPLSRNVYGGAPVDIWIIDGMFRPHDKLRWESRPR